MKITDCRKARSGQFARLILLAALAALALLLPLNRALANHARPAAPEPTRPAPAAQPPGPLMPAEVAAPVQPALSPAADFPVDLYLPFIVRTGGGDGFLNIQTRAASRDYYLNNYANQANIPSGWTGNYNTCSPGTTSAEFRNAVLRRVNYFRRMAGIPTVTFSDNSNRLAQAAAYLMSVNNELNHTPPPTWQCYTQDGYTGASSSNLAMGSYGWEAITLYINDWVGGTTNSALGHRRWILYPNTRVMGTGDIPGSGGHWTTNALRVFGDLVWPNRPDTRDSFVAWPPPGYVPRPVVFGAWSFSYPDANFDGTTITMTLGGGNVMLLKLPLYNNPSYGEHTIAWAPTIPDNVTSDQTYRVRIQNVIIDGQSRNFEYYVTLFTP